MKISGLGHINIVVDDIVSASNYYARILGAIPQQEFPHFKNIGFSKSAGFMDSPDSIDVTIRFMEIPDSGVFLELMQYHSPVGENKYPTRKVNDIGGIGHICLRVEDIDNIFMFIKSQDDVKLISSHPTYQPYKIDNIKPDEFYFLDDHKENDSIAKEEVCKIVSNIRYFYFIDKYGIQWEFEEGHSDIGH